MISKPVRYRAFSRARGHWFFGPLKHTSSGWTVDDQPIAAEDEASIQSSTRKFDRNGVEIYIGDIVRYYNQLYVVGGIPNIEVRYLESAERVGISYDPFWKDAYINQQDGERIHRGFSYTTSPYSWQVGPLDADSWTPGDGRINGTLVRSFSIRRCLNKKDANGRYIALRDFVRVEGNNLVQVPRRALSEGWELEDADPASLEIVAPEISPVYLDEV